MAGEVTLIAKIFPQNDSFLGLCDARQIIGDAATNVLPLNTISLSGVTQHISGTGSISFSKSTGIISYTGGGTGVTVHSGLTGLLDDDHTIYALLAGRSGGQTLNGSTESYEGLTIQSNPNNDGVIFFGINSHYDESYQYWGLGLDDPNNVWATLHVKGDGILLESSPTPGAVLILSEAWGQSIYSGIGGMWQVGDEATSYGAMQWDTNNKGLKFWCYTEDFSYQNFFYSLADMSETTFTSDAFYFLGYDGGNFPEMFTIDQSGYSQYNSHVIIGGYSDHGENRNILTINNPSTVSLWTQIFITANEGILASYVGLNDEGYGVVGTYGNVDFYLQRYQDTVAILTSSGLVMDSSYGFYPSTVRGITMTQKVTKFSIDGTFTANSDSYVPTEKAIKTYVTSAMTTVSGVDHGSCTGLLDDDHTIYLNTTRANTWLDTKTITDLAADAPSKNDTIKWNGIEWVCCPYNTTFPAFAVATFTCNAGTTASDYEIGSGVWKGIGELSFEATYSNGITSEAHVAHSGWSDLTMSGAGYVGPTLSTATVSYPSVDGTKVFAIHATTGEENATSSSISYHFHNKKFWGVSTKASSYTESDVEGLANSELTNTQSVFEPLFSITLGTNEYLIYAYPTRMNTAAFYDAISDPISMESPETVSITNSKSYTENYYVYRSTSHSLGAIQVSVIADL